MAEEFGSLTVNHLKDMRSNKLLLQCPNLCKQTLRYSMQTQWNCVNRIRPDEWHWAHDLLHFYPGWQQHTGFLWAPPHSLKDSVPSALSQLGVLLGHACTLGISGHWLLDSGMQGMDSSLHLETMCRVSQNCLSPDNNINTDCHFLGQVHAHPSLACTHTHTPTHPT